MPIYVYKCTQCEQYCEALQKASDEPKKTCPACQAEALIKVIAPVGVIFKGTGFHKNDYSSKSTSSSSSKPTGESSNAEAAPATAESKTTTEAKPTGESGNTVSSGGSDKVA